MAGQSAAALEQCEDVGELDALLVPCEGGGLLSALADDATRSFRTGTLHRVHNPPTIADGTRTPSLGEVTFPLVLR